MLYQAIKNSLIETTAQTDDFLDIEEMPVFKPTEQEFKNPIDYLESLFTNDDVKAVGVFKVIPPASFKPSLAFDRDRDIKLPTRY